MSRIVDILSVALLAGAALAFGAGVRALGDEKDLSALYFLVVGALLLYSATELLKPRAGVR